MNHTDSAMESCGGAPATVVFDAKAERELADVSFLSLLYARGYSLSRGEAPDLGRHWYSSQIHGFTLAWDTRNPVSITTLGEYQIAVIGRCYDLCAGTGHAKSIGERLLHALIGGKSSFGAALYDLAGRFVIVAVTPTGLFVETDATGMKAAYYATGGGTVASHAGLAASLAGTNIPSEYGDEGWFGRSKAFAFPGRSTEYADISLLTPNTRLSVIDGRVERVYPIDTLQQLQPAEAAAQILPCMQDQMAWITSNGQPQISLTAGLDSRVTLAASKQFREKCLYFSYATVQGNSTQSTQRDLEFASRMAEKENLRHIQVKTPWKVSGDLLNIMRKNSRRVHTRSVAVAYRNQLPPDAVHIRSNVYEIGRAFYHHGSKRERPPLSVEGMVRLLVKNGASIPEHLAESFDEWTQVTSFDRLPAGYDPYDLFYWEIRMGSWMQAVMVESDIAHDTYTLVNSRRILDMFLSVEKQSRITGATMYNLIHQAWPELLDLPINGVPASAANFR